MQTKAPATCQLAGLHRMCTQPEDPQTKFLIKELHVLLPSQGSMPRVRGNSVFVERTALLFLSRCGLMLHLSLKNPTWCRSKWQMPGILWILDLGSSDTPLWV